MAREKNQYGQYMTPKLIADFMVELIDREKSAAVLEPSCGTGVFIDSLKNHGFSSITAFEIDSKIVNPKHRVINQSFVSGKPDEKYDVIIGNPPYIRWKNLEKELKNELEQSDLWKKYCNSLCDYSSIFILKAVESLKENGELIFITPDYWITTTHAKALRNFLLENGYIDSIYHFNETRIFSDVSASFVIFKFIKNKNLKPKLKVLKFFSKKKLVPQNILDIKNKNPAVTENFELPQFEKDAGWILYDEETQKSIRNYENACKKNPDGEYEKLGDYFEIGNGMVSGLDKAFQIPDGTKLNSAEKNGCIKVVKAKSLNGYFYSEKIPYIFIRESLSDSDFKEKYPDFYQLLQNHREKLLKRYDYGKNLSYWEWAFLRNYSLFIRDEARIFVPCKERITKRSRFRFTYVEKGIYSTQDVTALFKKPGVQENILYVLALLNSAYVFKWLCCKGVRKGDIVEFSEKPVSKIPFRKIDFADAEEKQIHDKIVCEMQRYLETKDEAALEKVDGWIDLLMRK